MSSLAYIFHPQCSVIHLIKVHSLGKQEAIWNFYSLAGYEWDFFFLLTVCILSAAVLHDSDSRRAHDCVGCLWQGK